MQAAIDITSEPNASNFADRGNIYLDDLQQYEEAVAEYSKAIEISPNNQSLLIRRAIAHQRSGDQASSHADCDTLLSFEQKSPLSAHCRFAALYFALNRDEEAVAECLKANDVRPAVVGMAMLRAGLLLLADRPDLYRKTVADAFGRFGEAEKPVQRINLARSCILSPETANDPMEAVRLATLGVEAQPRTQWFLHVLGMAHLRAGQLNEAEQRLQESLEVEPQWEARRQNYLGLALVHHARGELEEAKDWYAKAVEQIHGRPASYINNTHDWLESHILFREAEQLLGTPDQPKDNTEPEQEE